jgi:hypothetical protein
MFEKYGKLLSLTIDALDENLRFYQFSELNIPRQLGSIKPDLPLIGDRKQKSNRQILDHTIAFVEVISWTRMSIQAGIGILSDVNCPSLVPMCKGERNSGALSLEPFEMSGLNFQVSVEHVSIGSTGEKKE